MISLCLIETDLISATGIRLMRIDERRLPRGPVGKGKIVLHSQIDTEADTYDTSFRTGENTRTSNASHTCTDDSGQENLDRTSTSSIARTLKSNHCGLGCSESTRAMQTTKTCGIDNRNRIDRKRAGSCNRSRSSVCDRTDTGDLHRNEVERDRSGKIV